MLISLTTKFINSKHMKFKFDFVNAIVISATRRKCILILYIYTIFIFIIKYKSDHKSDDKALMILLVSIIILKVLA